MPVSTALKQRCDPQGAVYLRHRNHKMRRDAVVPIDDELAILIQDQQARTRQRFPTTGVLLPRISANPDGRLPIPTATFRLQLGLVGARGCFDADVFGGGECVAAVGLGLQTTATASSFESVIAGLVGGQWAGQTPLAMAAAVAVEEMVDRPGRPMRQRLPRRFIPPAVMVNRMLLTSLADANFVGQDAAAIAIVESVYFQMWPQGVDAMIGCHTKAVAMASTLTPLSA
ncbi:hypothetical protein B4U45_18190 [Mycobacterium persicum]|uniref:PPE family protein PPE38 n=2 Tax=Mycobacterium persicum TaxID=1487726 RepID=A0A1X0LD50_9MYCO|nr:PPE domain-containing protein [Mycobacterium persicum]KZS79034.1 hypothetical protein A4G31_17070 [Mycobacterium persicum]ORB90849.1 hypothetical protein B1T49_18225 [Mycobacterium persicum]ORC08243.1 hypothetical protein B4U45_18190 [Mycobacterium persicum]VAZ71725.1 putative PPE family protein PPE38 [Mycobacterium persicum]VAZ82015.1 putative PPE family protein PPE38 [Mycobacterium persicum]